MADVRHPIFARMYARFSLQAERKGATEHRREMLAGLRGRVIEVGAGNGLNFAHYPTGVTEVVGVEPEAYLRDTAVKAARKAPVPVRIVDGTADRLPAEDESYDAGVASLVLCTVPDQGRALGELFRVIRPGGELRFYEHVRAKRPGLGRLQRFVDATYWPLVAGGCHTGRDTRAAIERAGFVIEACREFDFRICLFNAPATPHIVGGARRP
jgi:ubiquinone/menaquinone biosynthesis C-methylase UbiE